MALTGTTDTTMLVTPTATVPYGYGGNNGLFGNGDSWLGILFLIALCNGGFGFGGFGGGYGAMMGMGMADGGLGLYPWLNNSEHISDGFRDQQLSTQIGNIQNSITSGFGDVALGIAGVNQNICQTSAGITSAINNGFASTNLGICQGFSGVNSAISGAQNALAQQMYANQISDLERSFAAQTANTQGLTTLSSQLAQNGNAQAMGVADVKYTLATEACNNRATSTANSQAILNAINSGIQSIKDDLCQDRLDAERRENQNLRSELMYARGQASQVEQTAQILANNNAQTALFQQGLNNEVDALYNRLNNCPVSTVPVYGKQPIFTCGGNSCGCNGSF